MGRPSLARSVFAIAVLSAIATGSPSPRGAGADVDATGAFDVNPLGYGLNIRQDAAALSACVLAPSGIEGIPFGTGTIDPQTGAFSLSASLEFLQWVGPFGDGAACSIVFTGTFAGDGSSFTAQVEEQSTCIPPPFSCQVQCNVTGDYPVTGTRVTTTPFPCCGDGILEGAEQCDDGNLVASDCCNQCAPSAMGTPCPTDSNACTVDQCDGLGACQHTPLTGTACSDGLFCNGADICDAGMCTQHAGDPCAGGGECADTCAEGSDACWGPDLTPCADDGNAWTADWCEGVCQHMRTESCGPCERPGLSGCEPAPAAACAQPAGPGMARLVVRNLTDGSADAIRWGLNLPAAPASDFGSPASGDDYALCVYGAATPAAPTLLLQAHLVGGATCGTGPCWTESGNPTSGQRRYRDPAGAVGGTSLLRLQANATRSRITLKGKGANLGLPTDGWQAPLRIQVRSETGRCWESLLSDVRRSSATRLVVENE